MSTKDDDRGRTELLAYIANWVDTRCAPSSEILKGFNPEFQKKLGEAQLAMIGQPKREPSGAKRFFDAIEAGKDIEQAREAAGIDEQTFHQVKSDKHFDIAMKLALEVASRSRSSSGDK